MSEPLLSDYADDLSHVVVAPPMTLTADQGVIQVGGLVPAPGISPMSPGPAPGPLAPGPRAPGPAPAPAQAADSAGVQDCFDVPQSICIQDSSDRGEFVLSPMASVPDLAVWYQFDKSLPVDDTGNGRHLLDERHTLSALPYGPGVLGRGGSAAFNGRDIRVIPSQPSSSPVGALTPCFTVAFWIYLLEDSIGTWRTLFNRAAGPDQLTPALLLWPDERRLHLRIAPRADWNQGSLDSVGHLPLRRWTHLAVACTGSVLRLYINGIKDGEVILEGPQAENLQGDLYLGRDPWRAGTKSYIDDFRWYTRELAQGEIRALTFPSITGVSADFVSLGCTSCSFVDAVNSCQHSEHLCSLQELLAGGFHAARSMGWLSKNPDVWYHNAEALRDAAAADLFNGVRKLGLCCKW